MAEDEDKNPEVENADRQEPEADFEPQAEPQTEPQAGKTGRGRTGKTGKPPVTGKPSGPKAAVKNVGGLYQPGSRHELADGTVIENS